MAALDDSAANALIMDLESVSQDIMSQAAFASPVKKLDADNYTADDIDGVAETVFGSGNLNYLALQSQQMDEARALNDLVGTSQGTTFFSDSNIGSFVAQLATKLENLIDAGADTAPNIGEFTSEALIGDSNNDVGAAPLIFSTQTTEAGDVSAATSTHIRRSDVREGNNDATTTTNEDGDVTNVTNTTSTTNITNVTNNEGDNNCCDGGDITINLGDIITNIGDVIGDVGDVITNILTDVTNITDNTLTIVTDTVESLLTTINNIAGDTLTTITETLDLSSLQETINNILEGDIGDTVNNVFTTVTDIVDVPNLLETIINLAGDNVDNSISTVNNVTNNLMDLLGLDGPAGDDSDLSVDLGIGILGNTPIGESVDIVLDPLELLVGDIDIGISADIESLNALAEGDVAGAVQDVTDDLFGFAEDVGEDGLLGATENLVGGLVGIDSEGDGGLADLTSDIDILALGIDEQNIQAGDITDPLESAMDDLDITNALDLLNNADTEGGLGTVEETVTSLLDDNFLDANGGGLWTEGGLSDSLTGGALDDVLSGGGTGDVLGDTLGGTIPDPIGAIDEGLGLLNTGGSSNGSGGGLLGGLFG